MVQILSGGKMPTQQKKGLLNGALLLRQQDILSLHQKSL
jgi:hypothetical protein